MASMKIEQIHVKNFKLFKDVTVKNLPSFAVFVGENGAGKTTFFEIFGFLSDALKENVSVATNRRGGFRERISRGCTLQDSIQIEIKFRNHEDNEQHAPIITYFLEVGLEERLLVKREILKYRRGGRGKPWHFLDFSGGKGSAIKNEQDYGTAGVPEDREEQTLRSPDILAIKGLGQFERFKAISSFRKLLDGWYVSNLQIDAARTTGDIGFSQHLSSRGENIAQVASYLYENHPKIFEKILKKMSERIPGIEKVEAVQNETGQILLKFKDGSFKDPFVARYVSDGTIKMFAYLLLLHDPEPHPLLCIEEPENYLYPGLLSELTEELRNYTIPNEADRFL